MKNKLSFASQIRLKEQQ